MPASRNPFFIRTAEQSESDDQFLNLFSLTVLDHLPEDGSWNRLLPIESAPGAGKSTLLRLFTPAVLTNIANARHQPEMAALVQKLTEIDAIDADGVQLLGVLVNCKEDYNRLADLHLEAPAHEALFWALLHSRLALLTIRAALQLTGFTYPQDVNVVRFEPRADGVIRRPDARIITGRELFQRARNAEQLIVDSLNSFVPRSPLLDECSGVDDFFQLLNTHRILVEGRVSPKHILVMFDDAHLLDDWQRALLLQELKRHDQSACASWIAMRLRALEPPTLISEAVSRNREAYSRFRFDDWKSPQIETWLLDIGDRRAKRAQRDVSSFAACLSDSLETEIDTARLATIAQLERERAYELARGHGELYNYWLDHRETDVTELSPFKQAARWAQLQVLMERRINKLQGEFTFAPLPAIYVENAGSTALELATIFMSERNQLPYLYGAKCVAQLASSNVDQFLSLSAALFDLLLNSGGLGRRRRHQLPPSAQHRLILAESLSYVNGLQTSIPYGQDVSNIVTGIANLCRKESWRPNVPITPGVTGVSIQVSERDALIKAAEVPNSTEKRLLNALASAIAHNVLSLRLTNRQRDENRIVLYLNRLLCPAFGLPLGFGGYKPLDVSDFSNWMIGRTASHQPEFDIG